MEEKYEHQANSQRPDHACSRFLLWSLRGGVAGDTQTSDILVDMTFPLAVWPLQQNNRG